MRFEDLENLIKAATPVIEKNIASATKEAIEKSVKDSFETESFAGRKWHPLSMQRKATKAAAGYGNRKILQATQKMLKSGKVNTKKTERNSILGTYDNPTLYAGLHQKGFIGDGEAIPQRQFAPDDKKKELPMKGKQEILTPLIYKAIDDVLKGVKQISRLI